MLRPGPHHATTLCVVRSRRDGAASGANLFWAEIGPNPRDIEEHTEQGRGMDIAACRSIFEEAGYEVLEGPSRIYRQITVPMGDGRLDAVG